MSHNESKSPEQAMLDEIAAQVSAASTPDREKTLSDDELHKLVKQLAAQRDALVLIIGRYKKELQTRIKDI